MQDYLEYNIPSNIILPRTKCHLSPYQQAVDRNLTFYKQRLKPWRFSLWSTYGISRFLKCSEMHPLILYTCSGKIESWFGSLIRAFYAYKKEAIISNSNTKLKTCLTTKFFQVQPVETNGVKQKSILLNSRTKNKKRI